MRHRTFQKRQPTVLRVRASSSRQALCLGPIGESHCRCSFLYIALSIRSPTHATWIYPTLVYISVSRCCLFAWMQAPLIAQLVAESSPPHLLPVLGSGPARRWTTKQVRESTSCALMLPPILSANRRGRVTELTWLRSRARLEEAWIIIR